MAEERVVQAPRALLVAGMHRGGTSALGRVLGLHGLCLPETPMGAGPANPLGHWGESTPVWRVHEQLLQAIGSSWHDVGPVPAGWFSTPQAREYRGRMLEVLASEYPRPEPFVLKDPRIARLVPFWLDLLAEADVAVAFVIPIRHPLEVAASLTARNGFSTQKGALLWLRHVLDAERQTRALPRAFSSFDALLHDWRGTTRRIADETGVSLPDPGDAVAAEIDDFLTPTARNHEADLEALGARADLAPWFAETYAVLRATIDDAVPVDEERLDHVRRAADDAHLGYAELVREAAAAG